MSTTTSAARPETDLDLWSDEALRDPYPLWKQLRDLGPAVWLTRHGLWAVSRDEDVRRALRDWELFSSAKGVAVSEDMNAKLEGITLHTDPPEHRVLRDVLRRPLTPMALRDLEPRLHEQAAALVDRLVERGSFDAVADLAQHLPLTIVADLVGLPEEGREHMLEWAAANFQCFGPLNERAIGQLPSVGDGMAFTFDPTLPSRLKPGGWAAQLWEAADRGEIPHGKCPGMLVDYWAPALDTTIFGITSAVKLFGEHPDQWDLVRNDPALIPHAINEVLRMESPITGFTRVLTRDCAFGELTVAAGSRMLMMYGSANRDERKWAEPERFDVLRRPSEQLAFGRGEHQCAGMPLARMEMKAVLTALAARVERIELGASETAMNNVLHGLSRLDVSVRPRRR
jgi:cytochrome P450